MVEKVLRLMVSIIISIWIARNFGPALYGELLFALSSCAILVTFASLGMENYMVQVFSSSRENVDDDISAIFCLRTFASLIAFVCGCFLLWSFGWKGQKFYLCFILGLQIPLTSLGVFQARLKSLQAFTLCAKIQLFSLMLSSCFKMMVLLIHASMTWIAWAFVLDVFIMGFLSLLFLITQKRFSLKLNFQLPLIKEH